MKKITLKQAEKLVKEAIWDYVKSGEDLKGTDFDGGISCEFKSFKEMNIKSWLDKKIKKYKLS